jgi:UDP-GlcNAc:undecaprenyl-phosphate GlcNAc-1-phosphate transferase
VNLAALPFIIAALVAAAAAAFFLTPLAMRLAARAGAIDEPDETRRVHVHPVPRAGGLAVAAAFIGVAVIALVINEAAGLIEPRAGDPDPISTSDLIALLGGAALAAAFGFLDDRWQIRARWQFVLQLVLAGFAIALGVLILEIDNPLDFLGGELARPRIDFDDQSAEFLLYVAAGITAVWIIGMINSINFIDGLDGLSTGVSLIAAVTLGLISLTTGSQYQPMVALLCAILAGSLAGFLPWNFHPAKVFIGTTGVFVAGYALAILSILGAAKIAVALLVLGVPIIDTFWIITRRLAAGSSPFTPDRGHIHHRLLDLGLTHRGAVLLIYGICTLLAAASLLLTGNGPLYAFLGIVVGFGLVLYLLTRRAGGDGALEASSYPDDEDLTADDAAPRHSNAAPVPEERHGRVGRDPA